MAHRITIVALEEDRGRIDVAPCALPGVDGVGGAKIWQYFSQETPKLRQSRHFGRAASRQRLNLAKGSRCRSGLSLLEVHLRSRGTGLPWAVFDIAVGEPCSQLMGGVELSRLEITSRKVVLGVGRVSFFRQIRTGPQAGTVKVFQENRAGSAVMQMKPDRRLSRRRVSAVMPQRHGAARNS